jgi:hypothetical protein
MGDHDHFVCHLFHSSSPDLNPIETMFAQIKQWCRKNYDDLASFGFSELDIIHQAFSSRTLREIRATMASTIYKADLI